MGPWGFPLGRILSLLHTNEAQRGKERAHMTRSERLTPHHNTVVLCYSGAQASAYTEPVIVGIPKDLHAPIVPPFMNVDA